MKKSVVYIYLKADLLWTRKCCSFWLRLLTKKFQLFQFRSLFTKPLSSCGAVRVLVQCGISNSRLPRLSSLLRKDAKASLLKNTILVFSLQNIGQLFSQSNRINPIEINLDCTGIEKSQRLGPNRAPIGSFSIGHNQTQSVQSVSNQKKLCLDWSMIVKNNYNRLVNLT